MKFMIRDHQRKSEPYRRALADAGHQAVMSGRPDVVLIDYDIPHPAYEPWVKNAQEHGAPIVVYPHGFSATNQHNLLDAPIETAATLVPGPGQRFLMKTYDYPNPIYVTGWPGPHTTPEPRECKRVLFAPHHPFGSGWLPKAAQEANAAAFRILLSEPFELAVRHCGTLEQNGLWHEEGVTYHQGDFADRRLHVADVVVANGTYAAECMTRGVPVVMSWQEMWWRFEYEDREGTFYPEGWKEHRDFTRYPYEIAPGMCARAAEHPNSPEVQTWRERFMAPFDPEAFASLVGQIASRVPVCG